MVEFGLKTQREKWYPDLIIILHSEGLLFQLKIYCLSLATIVSIWATLCSNLGYSLFKSWLPFVPILATLGYLKVLAHPYMSPASFREISLMGKKQALALVLDQSKSFIQPSPGSVMNG